MELFQKLEILIEEKIKRDTFRDNVINALKQVYIFTDKDNIKCRQSATAGEVYQYLSEVLCETREDFNFKNKVRDLLVKENIIKPVQSKGWLWFKGLATSISITTT